VRLSERGQVLFHRLAEAAAAHDRRLRAGLGEEDLATLERLLTRLRRNVTDHDPTEHP
jgi:MarR family transcriptional regulator for hemolysin